jgi:dTDP-4-dehydrorhamnose 3,5-epimerase
MKFIKTGLTDVMVVEPDVIPNEGGFFYEGYNIEKYRAVGIQSEFAQETTSLSAGNVLRGLHAQRRRPQSRLMSVLEGEVFSVAVDIRRGSPSYGRSAEANLSSSNGRLLLVPAGFASGYYVLSDCARVQIRSSEAIDLSDEIVLLWNDPDLGINWPVTSPVLSARDRAALLLRELEPWLPRFREAA